MGTGTSSKMSNSRPEWERRPKRKEKIRVRAQQFREPQGLAWKGVGQLREGAIALAADVAGSRAPSAHTHIMEQKNRELGNHLQQRRSTNSDS